MLKKLQIQNQQQVKILQLAWRTFLLNPVIAAMVFCLLMR
jgi:hypothetical protein